MRKKGKKRRGGWRVRALTLLICAESKRDVAGIRNSLLVCGLPPGHGGQHHDIEWPVW
jgi:hypothetical protein